MRRPISDSSFLHLRMLNTTPLKDLLIKIGSIGDLVNDYLNSRGIELDNAQYSALVCFALTNGIGQIVTKGRALNTSILSGKSGEIPKVLATHNKKYRKILGITLAFKDKVSDDNRKKEIALFWGN